MDEESWFITLSTGIGGFLGWKNARQKVNDDCTLEYQGELLCSPLGTNEMIMEEYISWVYPSSIIAGLAFGLLAGALLVGAWKLRRTKGA